MTKIMGSEKAFRLDSDRLGEKPYVSRSGRFRFLWSGDPTTTKTQRSGGCYSWER
jgi:hypothetical protein